MVKPKLIPIQVPWQIVDDTSYFRLSVSEVNNVTLSFVGRIFGNNSINFTEYDIEVDFKHPLKTQTNVKWSDRNTINPSDYDWSEINTSYLPYKEVADSDEHDRNYKLFKEEWLETGICPVSNAYEIVGSIWTEFHQSFHHYLFVGADLYFECIASDMMWKNKGEIDWFKSP